MSDEEIYLDRLCDAVAEAHQWGGHRYPGIDTETTRKYVGAIKSRLQEADEIISERDSMRRARIELVDKYSALADKYMSVVDRYIGMRGEIGYADLRGDVDA